MAPGQTVLDPLLLDVDSNRTAPTVAKRPSQLPDRQSANRGQVGKAHPAFQPDRLQHGQLTHVPSLSRIAASIASSGLSDTTSVWPLVIAARTATSEWLGKSG